MLKREQSRETQHPVNCNRRKLPKTGTYCFMLIYPQHFLIFRQTPHVSTYEQQNVKSN